MSPRIFEVVWKVFNKELSFKRDFERHTSTSTLFWLGFFLAKLSFFFFSLNLGEKKFACPECPKRFMRSDHLSKHIKTHQNKKGGPGVALSVGTLPLDSGAGSEGSGTATPSALITTNMVAMEAICPEGIARLANSGINVMQVTELQSINISGNGF